jgi:uncharacterized protein YbjT (DUF2867 family)
VLFKDEEVVVRTWAAFPPSGCSPGMPIRTILTGATGMVGEGVLQESLENPNVGHVLVIGRRPCGYTHPKLTERIVPDLGDISSLSTEIASYDSCFFCMGVSSIGMGADEYYRITHDLTLAFASTIAKAKPSMTFCYVSGKATDSTEKGRVRWARVKGKTENDLAKLLPNAYAFRPGLLQPSPGAKHVLKYYKWVGWLFPLVNKLAPSSASTLAEVGRAMIHVAMHGYPKHVLEVKDIKAAAKV